MDPTYMKDVAELPTFVFTNTVRATKITKTYNDAVQGNDSAGNPKIVQLNSEIITASRPQIGDYVVFLADGERQFIPGDVFEANTKNAPATP
jgi:hypothetical protein